MDVRVSQKLKEEKHFRNNEGVKHIQIWAELAHEPRSAKWPFDLAGSQGSLRVMNVNGMNTGLSVQGRGVRKLKWTVRPRTPAY